MAGPVKANEAIILQRVYERLVSVFRAAQTVNKRHRRTWFVAFLLIEELAIGAADGAVRSNQGCHASKMPLVILSDSA